MAERSLKGIFARHDDDDGKRPVEDRHAPVPFRRSSPRRNLHRMRLAELPPILLGKRKLAITVRCDDRRTKVTLISPQGEMTPYGVYSQVDPVPGSPARSTQAFLPVRLVCRLREPGRCAASLFHEPDVLSVISFKVDKPRSRAPEIGREIEQARGERVFQTSNWMEQKPRAFQSAQGSSSTSPSLSLRSS